MHCLELQWLLVASAESRHEGYSKSSLLGARLLEGSRWERSQIDMYESESTTVDYRHPRSGVLHSYKLGAFPVGTTVALPMTLNHTEELPLPVLAHTLGKSGQAMGV